MGDKVPARRENSEKALGLEMARLFGMNPKLMMAPKAPAPSEGEEPDLDTVDDPAPGDDPGVDSEAGS